MNTNSIISARIDGIGGRLGAAVNGMRLARKLHASYSLLWQQHPAAANITDPGYIFDVSAMRELGGSFITLTDFLTQPKGGGCIYFDASAPRILPESAEASTWVISSAHPSALPNEKGEDIRAGLAEAADSMLRFSPFIQKRIEAHPTVSSLKQMVGVHVRRGDLIGNLNPIHRNRIIPEESYFFVIDAAFSDRDIFLCTEAEDVILAFRKRYGSRLVLPETLGWGRDSMELTRQAVIELALLSRCRVILGSNSSFSRSASFLENRPFLCLSLDSGFDRFGRELQAHGLFESAKIVSSLKGRSDSDQ